MLHTFCGKSENWKGGAHYFLVLLRCSLLAGWCFAFLHDLLPGWSACVKDPTVNLLHIKAICWRALPPRDIPLTCLSLAGRCNYNYIRLTHEEARTRFNRSESGRGGCLCLLSHAWGELHAHANPFTCAIWKTWPKLTSSVILHYPFLKSLWLTPNILLI